eukprot:1152356-Pelagomonas_calceolata.AAC.2
MAEGVAPLAHREDISAHPKDLAAVTCAKISVNVLSNSRRLKNRSVETMYHICRADQMWGGVTSALELWAFLL